MCWFLKNNRNSTHADMSISWVCGKINKKFKQFICKGTFMQRWTHFFPRNNIWRDEIHTCALLHLDLYFVIWIQGPFYIMCLKYVRMHENIITSCYWCDLNVWSWLIINLQLNLLQFCHCKYKWPDVLTAYYTQKVCLTNSDLEFEYI